VTWADPLGSGPQVRARIRRVVDYCAKLGRRRDVDDGDLFTVLPTWSSTLHPDRQSRCIDAN
jgi:hypothetical protein